MAGPGLESASPALPSLCPPLASSECHMKRQQVRVSTVVPLALSFQPTERGTEPCNSARAEPFRTKRVHPSALSPTAGQGSSDNQFAIRIRCERLPENAVTDREDVQYIFCMAGGALLNLEKEKWGKQENEGRSDERQVGSIFTFENEKQQLGRQKQGNNVPFLLFCKVSKPEALLQINVLLGAEFITTRLKSIKIEDFY